MAGNVKWLVFLGALFCCDNLLAQLFFNNGAPVYVKPGAVVQVNGTCRNAAGMLFVEAQGSTSGQLNITGNFINDATAGGDGIIRVQGDWINNQNFQAGTGTVILNGAIQQIGGNVSTYFYNLRLMGTGEKIQLRDQYIQNILDLTDRELKTEHYTMYVLNPSPSSVQRITGFVSSLGNGSLSRVTNSTSTYLFPVGSSVGTFRYRPVEIVPDDALLNTFTVRMANVNATSEGYDISLIPPDICAVNPLFYHLIDRTAGSSSSTMRIYFDASQDGVWDGIARWTTMPLWQPMNSSFTQAGIPLSYAQQDNWNDFSQKPYILFKNNISIDLGPDISICDGNTATLSPGAGYATYVWSTGQTTASIQVNTDGIYSVTVTDDLNCSASDEVYVNVLPLPVVTAWATPADICMGQSTIIQADGAISYQWSGGLGGGNSHTVAPAVTTTYMVTGTDMNNCQNTAQVQVVVHPIPNVSLGNDTTICDGDQITLDAGSGYIDYEWNIGQYTQSIVVSASGTYSVTVTDQNNCQNSASVSITTTSYMDPSITSYLNTFCQHDPPFQFQAATSGGIWYGSGITSTGLFQPSAAGAGVHTIIYDIPFNCGGSDTVQVQVFPNPVVSLGNDTTICEGSVITLDAGQSFVSYQWSVGSSDSFIQVSSAGTYAVTVTDANNCQGTAQITINVQSQADATIFTTGPFCSNNPPVQFVAAQDGGIWSGTGITSGGLFYPTVAGPGVFQITYTISGQCGDSDTTTIIVNPVPDITLIFHDESCIDAADGWAAVLITGGTAPYVILWSNQNSNDTISSLVPGIYSVTVTDTKGCGTSGHVTIQPGTEECRPPHVYVPNIFSPNGDGQNDVLYVYGSGIQQMHFIIYNRWGEKIFETDNQHQGWDGRFRGKECDPAVFVYVLNVTLSNQTSLKLSGTITLVR